MEKPGKNSNILTRIKSAAPEPLVTFLGKIKAALLTDRVDKLFRHLFIQNADYAALVVLILLVIIVIYWCVPKWMVSDVLTSAGGEMTFERAIQAHEAEDRARGVVGRFLAGIVVLIGLYFTWWRVDVADKKYRLDKDANETALFSRAVEHLGDDNIAIRLGGIYEMERLAHETENRDFYWQIMETLTAYVRDKAVIQDIPGSFEKEPQKDIQAIITVLGRRPIEKDGEARLNLRETYLRDYVFSGLNFEKANFSGAHLEEADFSGAQLKFTNFSGAHLEEAEFIVARVKRADFFLAHLAGANFFGTPLESANFFHLPMTSSVPFSAKQLLGAKRFAQEQINKALGNEDTTLPEGLTRPEHWLKSTTDEESAEPDKDE